MDQTGKIFGPLDINVYPLLISCHYIADSSLHRGHSDSPIQEPRGSFGCGLRASCGHLVGRLHGLWIGHWWLPIRAAQWRGLFSRRGPFGPHHRTRWSNSTTYCLLRQILARILQQKRYGRNGAQYSYANPTTFNDIPNPPQFVFLFIES